MNSESESAAESKPRTSRLESCALLSTEETPGALENDLARQAEAWLEGGDPSLALCFISGRDLQATRHALDSVQAAVAPKSLAGCSGGGVLGTAREIEAQRAVSVLLLRHPQLLVDVCHFTQRQVEESSGPGFWHYELGMPPEPGPQAMLMFLDPFSLAVDVAVRQFDEAFPNAGFMGGLASGLAPEDCCVLQNGDVHDVGGLVAFLRGPIRLDTVVSQGCTPVGEPLVVTKCDRNILIELGGRPAVQVLQEILWALPEDTKRRLPGNLFIGIATNEYVESFQRGDFLVRNLIRPDKETGAIVIGAQARLGQTVQFQMRDGLAATEDMMALLGRAKERLSASSGPRAAIMCTCNGRGADMFGQPDQDPKLLARVFHGEPALPVAGFFCNGEIGRIGAKAFVHGYTCCAGLISDA